MTATRDKSRFVGYSNVMEPITDTDSLRAAVKILSTSKYVTVDTEFQRESTFWSILCLIQIASPDDCFLVDALAGDIDLQPFYDLMADESVVKVFHASRQDIEIVHHQAGIIPAPLFDSQVAAMVLGYGDSISYDALVRKTVGAEIDKAHRFTDWTRRPLSDAQLTYAIGDVTHLRGVYERLSSELEKTGRADWVDEEMAILVDPATYEAHPEDAWKRLKFRVKKPKQIAVLMEVAAWRESEAQRRDMPRRRVLKDEAIYEIAAQIPRTPEALEKLRSIGRGFARGGQGKSLLGAVAAGLARDPDTVPRPPKPPRPVEGVSATTDLLKVLCKKIAEDNSVAQRVIANVDDLEKIAFDDDADVPALRGWRRELFGEVALALKRGEIGLAVKNGKVSIVETN